MSEMSTIKGGKYVQVTGVVVIVNDSTDDTNNNSNKAMVNVGTSKSDGNNSKDTITWLVLNSVDEGFDLVLYSGNGVLSGRQRLNSGISRDREYTHNIDGVKSTHRIHTHVSMVQ